MAKKTFRFPVTIGMLDPANSIPEVRDADGRLVRPASLELKHIAPGEPVELEEAEGVKLIKRHGMWEAAKTETGPHSRNL
jgi:hypothetical protein